MKTILNKIISFVAAAVVLSTGFAAVPNPIPETDDSIPVIQIDTDSNENEDNNGGEENQINPQCDDPEREILQWFNNNIVPIQYNFWILFNAGFFIHCAGIVICKLHII